MTRIARGTRRLLAVSLAALFAGISAACTFTGASEPETEARTVTGDRLRWFNGVFFNTPADRFRDRLANPLNLYGKPEDADLFESFTAMPPACRSGDECPRCGMTEEYMDSVLTRELGLTLEETAGVGLDRFTYDHGAYRWSHGDTNDPGTLTFLSGSRAGDTERLYQNSRFVPGWCCVTLRETGGGWRFVSNEAYDHPVIPTNLPAGAPPLCGRTGN